MRKNSRLAWAAALAAGLAAALVVAAGGPAGANVGLTQISSDPFTNSSSQHATEVEPDTYSSGSTIVEAQQTGRFFDGGSSDIGWATSSDGGATWTHGFLPGITQWSGGGTFQRVSDASVTYDAKHNVWLISSIPITSALGVPEVFTSRSTNGGTVWSNPVPVGAGISNNLDKNWIVCDDTATSPFYGNCYTEFDDNGAGNLLYMSTSTDGGLTWGAPQTTGNRATGLGGQPLVQPNGTVIVPAATANESGIIAFSSSNGGASWSSTVAVATAKTHTIAAGLRSGPLPSAEIDGAGKVYVGWQDCRFRKRCASNDIVYSTSTDGATWSAVTRIPIDPVTSTVDHFIPGLSVDKNTSGATASIGVSYYFYPTADCTTTTCQLDVGFVKSADAGATWSAATQLAGPMTISWLPNTSQGPMVGDYMSTSFSNGTARPAFEVAHAPTGNVLDQATYVPAAGLLKSLSTSAATVATTAADLKPVPGAASDHADPVGPVTSR